jgi:hypothetical protein
VTDLLPLLQDFYRDKLGVMLAHQANARLVETYDVNNAYQYLVNRDEFHLSWVSKAIADLGATPADAPGTSPDGARGRDAERNALESDARAAQAFVDRWKPRVEAMTNARHRGMLRVILGETLEQKRSFEQALAGRTDLLGRRGEQTGPAFGEVLPTRWIE